MNLTGFSTTFDPTSDNNIRADWIHPGPILSAQTLRPQNHRRPLLFGVGDKM
jgi:hypothetical protein